MRAPIIFFLSDLGLEDDAVGICKGLMLSICPRLTIYDITHQVRPFDIKEGIQYLADAPEYYPKEAIFCCIVYPETGTKVPVIALKNIKHQVYIAPNNGLLSSVIENSEIDSIYEVTSPLVIQQKVVWSKTFFGRDIIASCAAHIAFGFPLKRVGKRLQLNEIVILETKRACVTSEGEIMGEISAIDKNFGNIWTNMPMGLILREEIQYGEILEVTIENMKKRIPFTRTFGEVPPGEPLLYINSRGFLSLGLNKGDFYKENGISRGMWIKIRKVLHPPIEMRQI